jgi:hypothetical protein
MHTCERSAVVPPLRWVMGAIPTFLFLIGFFHRAASGARYPVEAYRDGFAVCAAQDPA